MSYYNSIKWIYCVKLTIKLFSLPSPRIIKVIPNIRPSKTLQGVVPRNHIHPFEYGSDNKLYNCNRNGQSTVHKNLTGIALPLTIYLVHSVYVFIIFHITGHKRSSKYTMSHKWHNARTIITADIRKITVRK